MYNVFWVEKNWIGLGLDVVGFGSIMDWTWIECGLDMDWPLDWIWIGPWIGYGLDMDWI